MVRRRTPDLGYQWEKCNTSGESCTAISGATSQTYVLGSGEVGATVRVTVTAKNSSGEASAASPASETIEAAASPSVSERPAITGTAKEGNELFAENGSWSGSQPLRYFYRWERCNSAGEKCTLISGATKPGYKEVSADVGSTLRVSVTVTNSLGGASSLSPQTSVVAGKEASTKEAMEVAEKTDPSVIAAPSSATLEEQTVKPDAEDAGEGLAATGTLTSSWLSKETSGEFAINTPIGEISLKPIGTTASSTVTPLIVNGAAAVYAGTQTATDTIVRPEPLGAAAMLQLRSSGAPTSFSWQVALGANQKLQVLPNGSVAVTESGAGSGLEGEVEETEEKPSNETPAETKGEEGYSSEAAAEAFQKANPEESKIGKLPSSSTSTTGETKPKSGELQPQETKTQYEAATTATAYAESHTENTTLMTLPAPTVVDAEDHTVPASLSVEGNTIKLSITPGSAKYPITAEVSADAPTNAASAKRTPAPTYGLSTQTPQPFEESEEEVEGKWQKAEHLDKNLIEGKAVQVKYARLVLPYDAEPKSPALETWLTKVGETKLPGGAHLVPIITFGKCTLAVVGEKGRSKSCLKEEKVANFAERYYHHVIGIMRAHIKGKEHIPPVRIWGAWNEPELSSLSAGQAANVWGAAVKALHKAGCRVYCKVIAGEFAGYKKLSGRPGELGYVKTYENAFIKNTLAKKWDAGKPEIWGMHDYKDPKETAEMAVAAGGKLVRKSGTGSGEAQAFVQGTRQSRLGRHQDWISEAGVQLWLHNGPTSLGGKTRSEEAAHSERQRIAAEDFLELGNQSTGHIEVSNYYQYKAPTPFEKQDEKLEELQRGHEPGPEFDSGLLFDEGKAPENQRPAYCVIALDDKGACPPAATTQTAVAASIKSSGATVSLAVNPSGALTKYKVEYGTTTSYGHTTTAGTTANAVGEQSETTELSGLEACTTYHFQAEAENAANESKPALGGDRTFKTDCAASSVSVGSSSACASLATGGVECWGKVGAISWQPPTEAGEEVAGFSEAKAISDDQDGTICALLKSGSVNCVGNGGAGQLGDGSSSESVTPVAVEGIKNATAISSGDASSCVVLGGGSIDCWGWNSYPEGHRILGRAYPRTEKAPEECGFEACSRVPLSVSGITGGISVGDALSGGHACGVLGAGNVECWGSDNEGELGDGQRNGDLAETETPHHVSEISNAISVSTGGYDSCAVLATGGVDCWGLNNFGSTDEGGALGHGEEHGPEICERSHVLYCSDVPVSVVGITDAVEVSVGDGFACARLSTGHVKCWGQEGTLGDGSEAASDEPVEVSGLTNASSISAGVNTACAVLSEGALECWGSNSSGQANRHYGEPRTVVTPIKVAGFE